MMCSPTDEAGGLHENSVSYIVFYLLSDISPLITGGMTGGQEIEGREVVEAVGGQGDAVDD